MRYKVIYAYGNCMSSAVNELQKKVEQLCREGWKPQGGITIAAASCTMCYACQAMVK